jgi:hypothetical protein
LGVAGSKSKPRQAKASQGKPRQRRLRQMTNKFHLYWFCSISSDGLAHVLVDQTIEGVRKVFDSLALPQS